MTQEIKLITKLSELSELYDYIDELIASTNINFISVDTEFIRVDTYYPILSLLQICIKNDVFVIDYRTLLEQENVSKKSFEQLKTLFLDKKIIKVFHSARQDCEILLNNFGIIPKPIFDTQIAAHFFGFGLSIGFEKIISKVFEINIDKQLQHSDWLERPLTNEQIKYAANDVSYLSKLYEYFLYTIQNDKEAQYNKQILDYVGKDSSELSNKKNYLDNKTSLWKNFQFSKKHWQQAALMKNMMVWRDENAKNFNKPRGHIIKDRELFEVIMGRAAILKQEKLLVELIKNKLSRKTGIFWESNDLFNSFFEYLQNIFALFSCEKAEEEKNKIITLIIKAKLENSKMHKINEIADDVEEVLKICANENNIDYECFAPRHEINIFIKNMFLHKLDGEKVKKSKLELNWRKKMLEKYYERIEEIIKASQGE